MGYRVVKPARVNYGALFLAHNLIDNMREATSNYKPDDSYGSVRYGGYSKQQLKDMAKLARAELQRFANDLDEVGEWVNEKTDSKN